MTTPFDSFLSEVDEGLNLSEKEIEVIRLLARDMNIEEISNAREVSQLAVKARLRQARTKVGCKNNYTLIAKAGQVKILYVTDADPSEFPPFDMG
ncbi:MAG: helix-turn-helix transcriptional regulator [Pseudomonadota bacterium]